MEQEKNLPCAHSAHPSRLGCDPVSNWALVGQQDETNMLAESARYEIALANTH